MESEMVRGVLEDELSVHPSMIWLRRQYPEGFSSGTMFQRYNQAFKLKAKDSLVP